MLDSRQEQISEKMLTVRRQQEESLRRREKLLEELERANQLTQREEKERERLKTERQQELEAQVRFTVFGFYHIEMVVEFGESTLFGPCR